MTDLDAVRKKLEDRRRTLLERDERLTRDIRHTEAPPKADSGERALDQENDEVLDALDEATREEIRAIDAALGRLAGGQYGQCTTCGKTIDARRLEFIPHAAQCATCAA